MLNYGDRDTYREPPPAVDFGDRVDAAWNDARADGDPLAEIPELQPITRRPVELSAECRAWIAEFTKGNR